MDDENFRQLIGLTGLKDRWILKYFTSCPTKLSSIFSLQKFHVQEGWEIWGLLDTSVFLKIKFYWNMAVPMSWCFVYGCIYTIMADLRSCNLDHRANNSWNIHCGSFTEKLHQPLGRQYREKHEAEDREGYWLWDFIFFLFLKYGLNFVMK